MSAALLPWQRHYYADRHGNWVPEFPFVSVDRRSLDESSRGSDTRGLEASGYSVVAKFKVGPFVTGGRRKLFSNVDHVDDKIFSCEECVKL